MAKKKQPETSDERFKRLSDKLAAVLMECETGTEQLILMHAATCAVFIHFNEMFGMILDRTMQHMIENIHEPIEVVLTTKGSKKIQ